MPITPVKADTANTFSGAIPICEKKYKYKFSLAPNPATDTGKTNISDIIGANINTSNGLIGTLKTKKFI